jgi:3-oxoadipate enol-lactonase
MISNQTVANTDAAELRTGPEWAQLPGVSLRYARSGGHGRPVLLLHEMGGSLESWDPVLARIPQDQQTIRCDARGSGGSEKIRDAITCEAMADDIASLLDHLSVTDAVDVAGVALGGRLGLTLAARHPERVHRLIAINPPTEAPGRSGAVLRERAELADKFGMRAITEAAMARSYPDPLRGDGKAYANYVARFLTNDPTSYAHIVRAVANSEMGDALGSIVCPTLFVSGRDDLVRPPATIAAVAGLVPGARHVVIDGGHILSVQAPEALASTLVEFFGWS